MFGRKKKAEQRSYDKEQKTPAVKASICTGERTAGFVDKKTGKFEDDMLIRSENDLDEFCRLYGILKEDLQKIW